MPARLYPTLAEALEIHRQLVHEFGGSGGLRDPGRLEAALFRPQIGYYAGLVEEAAALLESLVNNHPFVDGNKRLGFAVTDTFLRLNGHCLDVEPGAAHRFMTDRIAKGKFRFPLVRDWIRTHLRRLAG
ncbi:MAG: type II toxin-antitoxin system death-on-curing family toxin [Candidatus Acidiferrales bacterium]